MEHLTIHRELTLFYIPVNFSSLTSSYTTGLSCIIGILMKYETEITVIYMMATRNDCCRLELKNINLFLCPKAVQSAG